MDFETVLKRALADVDAAGVPSELRAFAFAEAVKHYSAQSRGIQATPPATHADGKTDPAAAGATRPPASGDLFDSVAAETGVSRADLEQLFYLDGDVPAFNLSARKLGANKAERHRAIALLMTCVRHYGLDETEVPLDVVRDACIKMNTYDSANFASYMGGVPGITLSGPRGKRVLRPRPEAKTKFKEKVASIVGTSDSPSD